MLAWTDDCYVCCQCGLMRSVRAWPRGWVRVQRREEGWWRERGREGEREREREADRQAGRQADRHRRTIRDRQTQKQTDRYRKREKGGGDRDRQRDRQSLPRDLSILLGHPASQAVRCC